MTQMFNDRVWIMDSGRWNGDTLCLKKIAKKEDKCPDGYSMFGVILSSKLPMIVYLRGLDPKNDFVKTARYDSYDDLIADGWRVD
jgi:hypothetical protein